MNETHSREALAAYSHKNRRIDMVAIVLFFASEFALLWNIAPLIPHHPFLFLLTAMLGYVGADFISGVVHWAGDTWGTPTTPVVGSMFIRAFREHHVDQTAITRHDAIETNGANCLASTVLLAPFLILSFILPLNGRTFFIFSLLTFTSLGLFATNQFHKWAHGKAPRFAVILQSKGLILSPTHHATHHHAPFDTYYCITVGWMNPILKRTKFFTHAERLIIRITGAKPRQSDEHALRVNT